MSDKNLIRIKQIRQKTGQSYSDAIPIGTRGLLVDMISELDLQEQIKLGGNHYTSISQTSLATSITEWYFSEPRNNRTLEQMSNYVTYKVVISMIDAVDENIVWYEPEEETEETYFIKANDDDLLVNRTLFNNEDDQLITISLYEGLNKLLHQKIIHIFEAKNSISGQIVVDQQIDPIGDINNPFISTEQQPEIEESNEQQEVSEG